MTENARQTHTRQRWRARIHWLMQLPPVRIWQHYLDSRGPILAGGMTYSSVFSVFAGLWIGFAVLGSIQARDDQARDALIAFINAQIPHLIDAGQGGLVEASALSGISATLTWTSIVAAGGLLFTSMGWIRSGRNGVRAMFGITGKGRGPFLDQIITFATLLLLAVLVVVGAAASVLTVNINSALLAIFGKDSGIVATFSSHIAAGAVSIGLDFTIIFLFVYVLANVHPRWRIFWPRALVGAIAISSLKVAGSMLAGGATSNPLLASFALFIGLMLWINIINQTFLVCVAWLAVKATDVATGSAARAPTPTDREEPTHGNP